jgi:ABC-2 type transport system permease protein
VARTAGIAWALFRLQLQRRLAYRGDLLVQALDEILRGLVALVMLQVYVSKTPALAGWDRWQLLFILGFSLVPVGLFHCLCGNLYQLSSHYIIQGNLDRVLLRPYPTFLQVCSDRIAIEDLGGVVLGVVLMAVAAGHLPVLWDPLTLLMLAVLGLSAFVLVVAIFMAFAATGFWFEDRVGMVPPVYNLMELGRWPDTIWHPALKILLTCIIPFSFVAFYPAGWLVSDAGWRHPALLTPLVAAVALGVAVLMWRSGLRRYHSSGS